MPDSTLGRVHGLLDDPIVTISTPRGRGAIGIVRISGSGADVQALLRHLIGDVAARLVDRQLHIAALRVGGEVVDRGLVVWFRGPSTYTGQDVAELHLHGNPVLLEQIVDALVAAGARAAGPGELTRRAVQAGRLSLLDAEGIDALIRAPGRAATRVVGRQLGGQLTARLKGWREELLTLAVVLEAAVDFPEDIDEADIAEDLRRITSLRTAMARLAGTSRAGRLLLSGVRVVLTGPVNAGKSTLFNALLGHDRAIVSAEPGTTRDLVAESVEWDGVVYRLEDTAGVRASADPVEAEGVARTGQAIEQADVVVVVRDGRLAAEPSSGLSVATHADLLDAEARDRLRSAGWLLVDGLAGAGVPALQRAIAAGAGACAVATEDVVLTTVRQGRALSEAAEALGEAIAAGADEVVLAAVAVRRAGRALEELIGAWPEERVLDELFARFCLGK